MTTSHSPLSAIKTQADKIAMLLKAAERGERIDARFAEKIKAARDKDAIKMAVVMDDKVIIVDIPWATIRATSEAGLAAWILDYMRGTRNTTH